jgi:hypothetical protein
MLRTALLALSVGALLCALPFAPHGVFAEFGPQPGSPPASPVGTGFAAPALRGPAGLPPRARVDGTPRLSGLAVRGGDGRPAAYTCNSGEGRDKRSRPVAIQGKWS